MPACGRYTKTFHSEAARCSAQSTTTAIEQKEAAGWRAGNDEAEPIDLVPIALDQVHVKAIAELPVYLEREVDGVKRYSLHCGEAARFSDFHRRRLQERSIRFIYVPRLFHGEYRKRVERGLEAIAADSTMPPVARAGLIYEMGLALLKEWMGEEPAGRLPRLQSVGVRHARLSLRAAWRCTSLFVRLAGNMNFRRRATPNVGFWMACLSYDMGVDDRESLETARMAGFLHDTGMRSLPPKMLAKAEPLTSDEWGQVRSHPAGGADFLKTHGGRDEALLRVSFEHHERLDGTGYPAGLKNEQIHPLAQLCAVVDSFEAMTSARSYKPRVQTIAEATAALQADAGKYDHVIVEAWMSLLKQASGEGASQESADQRGQGRQVHQRFPVECPMQLRVLTQSGDAWVPPPRRGSAESLTQRSWTRA